MLCRVTKIFLLVKSFQCYTAKKAELNMKADFGSFFEKREVFRIMKKNVIVL